jgi:hypothetical protein
MRTVQTLANSIRVVWTSTRLCQHAQQFGSAHFLNHRDRLTRHPLSCCQSTTVPPPLALGRGPSRTLKADASRCFPRSEKFRHTRTAPSSAKEARRTYTQPDVIVTSPLQLRILRDTQRNLCTATGCIFPSLGDMHCGPSSRNATSECETAHWETYSKPPEAGCRPVRS